MLSLQSLAEENLENILSFLSHSDLLHITDANRFFHDNEFLNSLWMKRCFVKWNVTEDELMDIDLQNIQFDHSMNGFALKPRFKELFPLAVPIPNEITTFDTKVITKSGNRVSFSGVVGVENRSVRADTPFPEILQWCHVSVVQQIYNIFFCRPRSSSYDYVSSENKPFVTPFLEMESRLNISRRHEAYYEVEISRGLGKASSFSQFNSINLATAATAHLNDDESIPDCVAVGLASSEFCAHKRLPGWDKESYGYHGDDGGIFHGRGNRVAEFGPTFGIGDTVGCGINYRTQTIFFTLNGNYLGNAFFGIKGTFYPTVGIDAAVNVNFNFGRAPFVFDLAKYSALNRI